MIGCKCGKNFRTRSPFAKVAKRPVLPSALCLIFITAVQEESVIIYREQIDGIFAFVPHVGKSEHIAVVSRQDLSLAVKVKDRVAFLGPYVPVFEFVNFRCYILYHHQCCFMILLYAGRTIFVPLTSSSILCALQPATLAIANIGVYISLGMSIMS